MKKRFKKFYQDHKTELILGASSVAVAVLVTRHKCGGQEIVDITHWSHPDGRHLVKVDQKNGQHVLFPMQPAS